MIKFKDGRTSKARFTTSAYDKGTYKAWNEAEIPENQADKVAFEIKSKIDSKELITAAHEASHVTSLISSPVFSHDLKELKESSMKKKFLGDLYNLFIDLPKDWKKARETLSNFPKFFSKNRMSTEIPSKEKFLHSVLALDIAYSLSDSYLVIDVDSINNPNLPSAADITLWSDTHGLIFMDITQGYNLKVKNSNLISCVQEHHFDLAESSYCISLRVNSSYSFQEFYLSAGNQTPSWNTGPESIVNQLADMFVNSSKQECEALTSTLNEIFSGPLAGFLPTTKEDNNLLHQTLKKLKVWFDENVENKEKVMEEIEASIQGRGVPPNELWAEFMEELLKEASCRNFALSGCQDIKLKARLKKFPVAAPVTLLANPLKDPDFAAKVDDYLWAAVSARDLNERWSRGDSTTYKLLINHTLDNNVSDSEFDFDSRQYAMTRFEENVIAMVRLLPFEVKDESGNPTGEFKTPSYFQLLVNPKYVADENYQKFLSRKDKSQHKNLADSWVNANVSNTTSMEYVKELSKDLIPSYQEVIQQAYSVRGMRPKTTRIMKKKANPAIAEQMSIVRARESSLLLNFFEANSVMSRAFTAHLGIKHPENCVMVLEAGDICALSVYHLPGTWPSFRTTWRKTYTLTESSKFDLYDLSWMSNHELHGGLRATHVEAKTVLDQYLLQNIQNKDIDYFTSSYDLALASRADPNNVERALYVVSSKYHSIDQNHLEWELELNLKAYNRLISMCEYRSQLYNDLRSKSRVTHERLDLEEINLNLLHFHPNRQQFSVICTAWRYLHQALGSIDYDPISTLKKLDGLSLKSHIEVAYWAKMVSVYKLALVLRSVKGMDSLRASNKEIFVVAPDLLFASNSASLNVSSYSTSNMLNVDKNWRVASEAICVLNAMEQHDALERSKIYNQDEWFGMPKDLRLELVRNPPNSISELIIILKNHSKDLAVFTEELGKKSKETDYLSNFWFEVMVHSLLATSKDRVGIMETLGGRSISEFMTTRGSLVTTKLESYDDTNAVRKATAFSVLLLRLFFNDASIETLDAMSSIGDDFLNQNIDQYQLSIDLMSKSYVDSIEPTCQFSEKDAPGKDREISTLNIEFGMLCLLSEKICQPYSSRLEEDLVTHSAKEWSIYNSIRFFENNTEEGSKDDVVYVNQDKSKYGPNRKVSSMLITAAFISKDMETFNFMRKALLMSKRKKISYPHELVRQALQIMNSKEALTSTRQAKVRVVTASDDSLPVGIGKTAKMLRLVYEQFMYGNRWGKKGSTWITMEEGMPGQGIFTTLSSISHAAAQRYFSKVVGRTLGWSWSARVTSDDSLTMIRYPRSSSLLIHNGLLKLICQLTIQMGLIENKAKMTITARRPEMNTFYLLKGEPIVPLWKFSMAYASCQFSGNLGEDLLSCVSKGSDLYRVGGSAFVSSYLSATLISQVLEAYRVWGAYIGVEPDATKDDTYTDLWDCPVEVFGLPSVDPLAGIVSPIGTKIVSALGSSLPRGMLEPYSTSLLNGSLFCSRLEQDLAFLDKDGNKVQNRIVEIADKDGLVHSACPRAPPTTNGLIGSLNVRHDFIRIARELDKVVLRFPKRTKFGGHSLKGLFERLPSMFEVPLKRGHSSTSTLMNYRQISHSTTYKFLKVSPNSHLPREFLGKSISLVDFRSLLMDRKHMTTTQENFLTYLKNVTLEEDELADISNLILESTFKSMELSDTIRSCKLAANENKNLSREDIKEMAMGRSVRKRLIKLFSEASKNVSVNEFRLLNCLFSRYSGEKPDDIDALKGSVTRLRGRLDQYEAFEEALLAKDRIMSMLPKPGIFYSECQPFIGDPNAEFNDWVRYNAMIDHHYKLPSHLIERETELIAGGLENYMNDSSSKEIDIWLSYSNGPSRPLDITYAVKSDEAPYYKIDKNNIGELADFSSFPALSTPVEFINQATVFKVNSFYWQSLHNNLIQGLWYGGAGVRVKVESKGWALASNGKVPFIEITSCGIGTDGYHHQLVWLGIPTNLRLELSQEIDAICSDYRARYGGSKEGNDAHWSAGKDHYDIQRVSIEDAVSLLVNFVDIMISDVDMNWVVPTTMLLGQIYHKPENMLQNLGAHVVKPQRLLPNSFLPKTTFYSWSEETNLKWVDEFSKLMEDLIRNDAEEDLDKSMFLIDLAASFLLTGSVASLTKETHKLLEGSHRDIASRQVRADFFKNLCLDLPQNLAPVHHAFYSRWEEVEKKIIVFERKIIRIASSVQRNNDLDNYYVRMRKAKNLSDYDLKAEAAITEDKEIRDKGDFFLALSEAISKKFNRTTIKDEIVADSLDQHGSSLADSAKSHGGLHSTGTLSDLISKLEDSAPTGAFSFSFKR